METHIATKCLNSDSEEDCSKNPNCNYNVNGCEYISTDGTRTSVYCAPKLSCEVDDMIGTIDLVFNTDGTCPGNKQFNWIHTKLSERIYCAFFFKC